MHKIPTRLAIAHDASGERLIKVRGRFAQTLEALVEAGDDGVTALEMSSWALRLAHYVFILRSEHGLDIETVREAHTTTAGNGWHARYVLRTTVRIIESRPNPEAAA